MQRKCLGILPPPPKFAIPSAASHGTEESLPPVPLFLLCVATVEVGVFCALVAIGGPPQAPVKGEVAARHPPD